MGIRERVGSVIGLRESGGSSARSNEEASETIGASSLRLIPGTNTLRKYFRESVVDPPSGWPTLAGIDTDEHLWRNMNGINPRDLTSWDQTRMIEVAYWLSRTNPLAKRIMNTNTDFVWGNGPFIWAPDPTVDKWIQDFWHDPVNRWKVKGYQKVRDLGVYGEQAWTLYTNPISGRVRCGYLSPMRIKDVVIDPDNPEMIKGVKQYTNPVSGGGSNMIPGMGSSGSGDGAEVTNDPNAGFFAQLQRQEDAQSGDFGLWTGDVLYMAINKTGDGKRGISDLYDLADWIDLYDQFLFARTEKIAHMNQWFWDVQILGADQKRLDDWLTEQLKNPVRPGAIRAHNESVTWAPMAANLQADDAHTDAEQIKAHILAGSGQPPTWYPGGDSSRAAAVEMAEPTMRTLLTRQTFVQANLEDLLEYVVQQRMLANPELAAGISDPYFVVQMDPVSSRDMYRSGTAFWRVNQGLQLAVQQGMIDVEAGKQIFYSALDMLGIGHTDGRYPDKLIPDDDGTTDPYMEAIRDPQHRDRVGKRHRSWLQESASLKRAYR